MCVAGGRSHADLHAHYGGPAGVQSEGEPQLLRCPVFSSATLRWPIKCSVGTSFHPIISFHEKILLTFYICMYVCSHVFFPCKFRGKLREVMQAGLPVSTRKH